MRRFIELKQIYGFSTRGARRMIHHYDWCEKDDRKFFAGKDPSGNKRTKFLRKKSTAGGAQ